MVGSHAAEFFAQQNPKNKVIVLDNLMLPRYSVMIRIQLNLTGIT